MYFFIYPLIAFTLAAIHEADMKAKNNLEATEEEGDFKIWELCKIPRFLFGLLS